MDIQHSSQLLLPHDNQTGGIRATTTTIIVTTDTTDTTGKLNINNPPSPSSTPPFQRKNKTKKRLLDSGIESSSPLAFQRYSKRKEQRTGG